jgi:hypothetical protein
MWYRLALSKFSLIVICLSSMEKRYWTRAWPDITRFTNNAICAQQPKFSVENPRVIVLRQWYWSLQIWYGMWWFWSSNIARNCFPWHCQSVSFHPSHRTGRNGSFNRLSMISMQLTGLTDSALDSWEGMVCNERGPIAATILYVPQCRWKAAFPASGQLNRLSGYKRDSTSS